MIRNQRTLLAKQPSKHCSIAHRIPLSQTKSLRRQLAGALQIKYEYFGSASKVLRIKSQTSFSGSPSLARTTLFWVNSYSIGPLVPSDTFRRYQGFIFNRHKNHPVTKIKTRHRYSKFFPCFFCLTRKLPQGFMDSLVHLIPEVQSRLVLVIRESFQPIFQLIVLNTLNFLFLFQK